MAGRGQSQTQQAVAGWLMALPALTGLTLFVALPFGIALAISFTNMRLGSPLPVEFVGLEQYRQILTNDSFQRALLNNLLFAAVVVPVQTMLALLLALLLNTRLKGMVVFRTAFFLPVVFPMALVAVVWELMYAPGPNGMMNAVLGTLTFGWHQPQDFLHDPALALPAIMAMSIWQGVGFQMIVLLAGLQSIPEVLYESAAIDRARTFSQFFHVTLPQLRNPLIFTALVTTILAFRLFAQVDIMTQGGPLGATNTVMYETVTTVFDRQQLAAASAMTVIFFLVVLAIALVQRRVAPEEREVA